MESSVSRSPAESLRWRLTLLLAALALALYAVFLADHVTACAAGADSSGYLNHARLLAGGGLRVEPRELPELSGTGFPVLAYLPLGFICAPDGRGFVPSYPPGLPLLIAAAAPIAGWDNAANVVMVFHALLGVLLVFALGRELGLSRPGAAVGALIVAVSPVYVFMALLAMSDVPALVWTTAAVLFAWRSREKPAWAFAAGAAAALAVLIRPSDALVLGPLAFVLGRGPGRWLRVAAGGLPGALFLAAQNRALYGRILATGYPGAAPLFGGRWMCPTLLSYARWLPILFTPVVVLGALAAPWLLRKEPRKAGTLAAWALAFAVFYAFYASTHETWWYSRFLLPAAPAFVVGGLWAAESFLRRICSPRWNLGLVAGAAIAVLANGLVWTWKLGALDSSRGERVYPQTVAWLRESLPADAVLAVMQLSGSVEYYSDFTFVRWDALDHGDYATLLAAARAGGRPVYAALFPFETEAALREHMPDRWLRVGACRQVEVWRPASEGSALLPMVDEPDWPYQLASFEKGRVIVQLGDGWFGREADARHTWVWSTGPAKLEVGIRNGSSARVRLGFGLRSLRPRIVEVRGNGVLVWRGRVAKKIVDLTLPAVPVADGRTELTFDTDAPAQLENSLPGARTLAFALYDPRLVEVRTSNP